MVFTFVSVGISMLLVYFIFSLYHRYWNGTRIPGPRGLPLLGSVLHIKLDRIHHQFYNLASVYGKIFAVEIFNTKTVVLNDVETIHKAFAQDGQFFNDRPVNFLARHLGFAEGISLRDLDKVHRSARKAFVKSLHVYGSGIPKFEKVVQEEITKLMKEINSYDGKELEVTEIMKRSIVNVMSILLIGEEATDDDATNFFDLTAGGDFFMNPVTNTLLSKFPFLQHLPFYKRRIDTVKDVKRKIEERYFYKIKDQASYGESDGIIKELLQFRDTDDGENLSDGTIKSIALLDVFSAGVMTTSSVIPSIILCLVNHPECQKRLQAELDSVIGKGRQPSISDRQACVFFEAVFMETTRLILPGAIWIPHICREDREFEGYKIKANTQVLANAWFVHHDIAILGDPWNFQPERFLGEDGKLLPNDHKFMKSWIPFGIGFRRCPGMGMASSRIFLYIAAIFQKYRFLPVEGKCWSCDPRSDKFVFELLVRPKPFYCVARDRQT